MTSALRRSSVLLAHMALLAARPVHAQPAPAPSPGVSNIVVNPAFVLLTEQVPENGALILGVAGAESVFTVVDAAGQPVTGALTLRDGIAFFRPERPWALGMTYTVNIPYDYDESQTLAAPFSVAPASTVALPVPALQLSTRLYENRYHLYCTEADQQTIVARVLERLDAQVLLTISSPPSTVDTLSAQQLLLTPVIDGAALRTAPAVGTYSTELTEPAPAPSRICGHFRGLDLRTMTTSDGPETCIDNALQPYKQEFEVGDALAVAVCPYPDADHHVVWCTYNRAHCEGADCPHYPQLCEGAPAVRDAGTVAGGDAGKPDATTDAASPEPAAATGSTDGGCQITTKSPRGSAASMALLLACFGLLLRSRRVRLRGALPRSSRTRAGHPGRS